MAIIFPGHWVDDGLTQYPCPSHAGWQQTVSGRCQAPFSRAQPWHSFCEAQQKHHTRTKHSKWFLTGYSEISKRIYYWGLRFCLLIGFCSLLVSGQTNIWCKKKREEGMEAGREGERDEEREGKSKREKGQERAWKTSCFVGGLKSVFQTSQCLGQKFIKQAVLLTYHKSRALCTWHLQFFLQIKVCALLHSKELLPSGPRAMPIKKGSKLTWERGMPHCQKEGGLL